MDESERRFVLSSIAHPSLTVEPHETRLVIYTAARSGDILLKVRCYGDVSSPKRRWRARIGWATGGARRRRGFGPSSRR